jgi:hypothetical protein
MEPWRVCRTVVADSHHFDEEEDPNPEPHSSKKLVPDPLRISFMRIRNPVFLYIKNLGYSLTFAVGLGSSCPGAGTRSW